MISKNKLESLNVKIISLLVLAFGVINVLSSLTPALKERLLILIRVLPLFARQGARTTAVLAGFFLMHLALNLWRRKKVAWLLTVAILILSAASHLLKGLDFEEASLALVLVIWLLLSRKSFYALSDTPSVKQGLKTLIFACVFTFVYALTGFYLLDKHFKSPLNFQAVFSQILITILGGKNIIYPATRFGRYFQNSIFWVFWGTLTYSLFMLLRPVLLRYSASRYDRDLARRIVDQYGKTPLSRIALLPDKSYFYSSGGSVISFVVKAGVALALGDPIGPLSDIKNAVKEFKDYCTRQDWRPAFYQVGEEFLNDYKALGFDYFSIGEEAVVDVTQFSLEGGERKDIRNAVNKLLRLGYVFSAYKPPISPILLDSLRAVSNQWLNLAKSSEKRFSFGWFDEEYIQSCTILAVKDESGKIMAFANVIPPYSNEELSIDLMRRRPQAESGTMDFLFVNLMEYAKNEGYGKFNFGLSALFKVGEKENAPAIEKTLKIIYERANRFYNFKSLNSFKDKFNPQWSPKYLVYMGPGNLPLTLTALVRAHS